MLSIFTMLLPLITNVVGRIIPDPGQAAQVSLELQKALLEQQGAIDRAIAEAAKAQAEVNLEEAKNPNIFVSGWRPAVGWICVAACAWSFIFQPIIVMICSWFGAGMPPYLDVGALMTLLGGMLGLGTLRTVEKVQGVK